MKLFKINISIILLMLTITNSFAQAVVKRTQSEFSVNQNIVVEIESRYTNVEVELTDDDLVTIDAIMQVEGLPEKDVDAYFEKWDFKASMSNNKVSISSFLTDNSDVRLKKSGYYKGYFFDKEKLNIVNSDLENLDENSETNKEAFDLEVYIEKGNAYLEEWERENNENIGRRWYNKTKEERIQLRKLKKEALPKLDNQATVVNKAALKNKSKLPSTNIRALSKRAVINKTLKIKIPRKAKLHIKARYGKLVFSEGITGLNAELSYVLLQASEISGNETLIKGSYSNFEIDKWNNGNLDVVFSGFVLIKEVKNMDLTSNASTVSIDNVTKRIDAKGNFKMLSVDMSSEIEHVNINVEDSKKVWLKLPKAAYNLQYEGVNSKLIHPKKFSLMTIKGNPDKQVIQNTPLKANKRVVKIKALYSVMQIYDIPWENLKIKSLQE